MGFEPMSAWITTRNISTMLQSPLNILVYCGCYTWLRTRILPVNSRALYRLSYIAILLVQRLGIEPKSPGLQPGALPFELSLHLFCFRASPAHWANPVAGNKPFIGEIKNPDCCQPGFQRKLPEGHSLPVGKLVNSFHPDYHALNTLLAHGWTDVLVLSPDN